MEIARLHYITQDLPDKSHAEQAAAACAGGVRWVQLRTKGKTDQEWLRIALEVQQVCNTYDATFIINDNVVLVKEIDADGVHLGKTDMSPTDACTILGPQFIIGGTANSLEDAIALYAQPVDYIGLGPYRFTSTKENLAPILGIEGIDHVLDKLRSFPMQLPVIAIGGILHTDVQPLIQIGSNGIAVSSAINLSKNPTLAASLFLTELD